MSQRTHGQISSVDHISLAFCLSVCLSVFHLTTRASVDSTSWSLITKKEMLTSFLTYVVAFGGIDRSVYLPTNNSFWIDSNRDRHREFKERSQYFVLVLLHFVERYKGLKPGILYLWGDFPTSLLRKGIDFDFVLIPLFRSWRCLLFFHGFYWCVV